MANASGKALGGEQVLALRAMVDEHGPGEASRRLLVSENTLARALAALTISRASRIIIEARLAGARSAA